MYYNVSETDVEMCCAVYREGEATFKADGCADLDFKGAEDSDASAELTVCLDEDTGTGTVNGNFENDDGQEYDLQTRVNGEGHVVFVLDMKKLEDMQNSGDAVVMSISFWKKK